MILFRRTLLLILTVFFTLTLYSRKKPAICVIVDKSNNLNRKAALYLERMVSSSIRGKGFYRVKSKKPYYRHLKILRLRYQNERQFRSSKKRALHIARFVGAKFLVFGKLTYDKKLYNINVFLLRSATGERIRYLVFYNKKLSNFDVLAGLIANSFIPNRFR